MKDYRSTVVEICECGHPSQDHDPWPECTAEVPFNLENPGSGIIVRCSCREWRPR